MNKFILAIILAGYAFTASGASVVRGISTNGHYSFKAFGPDLLLYKGNKMIERCVTDETNRGIDYGGNPYVLDLYSCANRTKTLGIKTFGNINDGGWVFLIETRRGQPVKTMQELFFITTGANSL